MDHALARAYLFAAGLALAAGRRAAYREFLDCAAKCLIPRPRSFPESFPSA